MSKKTNSKPEGVEETQVIDPETTENQEVNENQSVTVTKSAIQMAEKVQKYMAEGKTLQEALTLATAKTGRQTIDRVAYIKGLTNLVEIRKTRKTAYAKRSKAKDKPETMAKYQLEIDAASVRLNELLAEVNSAECPWKKALEYGETTDGALQYFINEIETEVSEKIDKLGLSKAKLKALLQATIPDTEFVPEELLESYTRRIKNRDQRLCVLSQRVQFLKDTEAGIVKFKEDAPTEE